MFYENMFVSSTHNVFGKLNKAPQGPFNMKASKWGIGW